MTTKGHCGIRRWAHYWTLWRSLPAPERRARAGRVTDRWIQRGPFPVPLRRAIARSSRAALRRASRVELDTLLTELLAAGVERGPLFGDLRPRASSIAAAFPVHAATVMETAEQLLRREFELLGSKPMRPLRSDGSIDWHRDWGSDVSWSPVGFAEDLPLLREGRADIKRPWELARFQHLLVLGQAYHLAPHRLSEERSAQLRHSCAEEAAAENRSA